MHRAVPNGPHRGGGWAVIVIVKTRDDYRRLAKIRRTIFLSGVAEAQERAVREVHKDMGTTTAFRDITGRLRRGVRNPILKETRSIRSIRTEATILVPYATIVARRTGFPLAAMGRAPVTTLKVFAVENPKITRAMGAV